MHAGSGVFSSTIMRWTRVFISLSSLDEVETQVCFDGLGFKHNLERHLDVDRLEEVGFLGALAVFTEVAALFLHNSRSYNEANALGNNIYTSQLDALNRLLSEPTLTATGIKSEYRSLSKAAAYVVRDIHHTSL